MGRTTTIADGRSVRRDGRPVEVRQLTRRGVLAVWAAATVPMGVLAWVLPPLVASGTGGLVRAMILGLTGGLVWQCVLVLSLVRREQGTLRWAVLREALWLRAPRSPRTGRRGGWAWLVALPALVVFGAQELLPELPHDPRFDLPRFLDSTAGHALLAGGWGWFAVLVVMCLFNTVLGEELLFRGYLLPRMAGAFGRWDWLANGVLFAGYHVHAWWGIPGTLLDALALCWPAKHYRSALLPIVVHSSQSVVVVALVLAVVLQG
jgi:membrane protease YdiL (CAAX protease family)